MKISLLGTREEPTSASIRWAVCLFRLLSEKAIKFIANRQTGHWSIRFALLKTPRIFNKIYKYPYHPLPLVMGMCKNQRYIEPFTGWWSRHSWGRIVHNFSRNGLHDGAVSDCLLSCMINITHFILSGLLFQCIRS